MSYKNHQARTLYTLVVILSILYVPVCRGEINGEFLLFPRIISVYRSDLGSNSVLDEDDHEVAVDFFVTFETANFRFLGEYLLSSNESEMERFQFGWLFENHLFWLGRFHNPAGYWNSQYHHGSFLETSISRPAIVEFEDEGGIVPVHLAGLLVEGTFDRGEQELGYALAFGAGPEFTDELEAWDVLRPGSGTRDISATLNLYLDSVAITPSRIGLFGNYTKIPASAIGISEIQQISAGIYGSWEFARWRWHGSSLYIENKFKRPSGSQDGAFFNAYVQAEYELNDSWIFYARIEQTLGSKGDAYLALFPEFIEDRIIGGMRYDFASQNALKLELSANQMQQDDFAQIMLQWSAQF